MTILVFNYLPPVPGSSTLKGVTVPLSFVAGVKINTNATAMNNAPIAFFTLSPPFK